MLDRVKRYLAPPVFEDLEANAAKDKTRVAGPLNALLLILLATSVAILVWMQVFLGLPTTFDEWFTVLSAVTTGVMSVGLLFLLRRGHVSMVGVLLSSAIWVIITLWISSSGGIRDTGVTGYFLVIIIAGLILGGRAAITSGLACILAAVGAFYAQTSGVITVSIKAPHPFDLIVLVLTLGMAALLLRFVVRSTAQAFERVRHNERALTESNRELESEVAERKRAEAELGRYRDHLEELVKERTVELTETNAQLCRVNDELTHEIAERVRVEEALQQRNRELATLYEASTAISSDLSLDVALQVVAEQMAYAIGSGGCTLSRWDRERNLVETLVDHSTVLPDTTEPPGTIHDLDDYPATRSVLETGQPVVIQRDDPLADEAELTLMEEYGGHTLLILPLVARDHVLGLVELVDYVEAQNYTSEQIRLAQSLAAQAAIAIENARLYAETQRQLQEQIALREAGIAISSTLDLKAVLSHIAEQMSRAIDTTSAYISTYEPGTMTSVVVAEYIGPQACPRERMSDLGVTYVEDGIEFLETLQAGTTHINHADDPDLAESDRLEMQQFGAQTILFIPLLNRDQLIGFAELYESRRRREFTPEEIVLCQDIAQQAAIAIENARLYEQAQHEIAERKQAEEALQKQTHALRESEEHYRTLFEHLPIPVFTKNREGEYTSCNAENQRYWAVSPIGRTDAELLDRKTAAALRKADLRVMETGDTLTLEEHLVNTPLGERQVLARKVPLRDGSGHIVGILGASIDITERKRVEVEREQLMAQIQEQAQRVQQIIDTVPEGVLLLNADGQVMLVNPVAEKDLVTLADAKVGDTLTHLGDRPLAELLTSPPKGLWHAVEVSDRSFQVISRSVSEATETGPTPSGWVLVIRDVTQAREIERRIRQQEKLAAVGQLAAGIAHDFNNIMATIVLYAQMTARDGRVSDRVRERMVTINQQAQHATNLIRQILDFSRRSVLERCPIDLLPFLKEQVQLLERTLPESIEIKLDYGPDEYTVNADLTSMQQMVMNLTVNARDAMPEGGNLHIELERVDVRPGESPLLPEIEAGDWVRMTVSDTGMGIRPNDLRRVFEPFFTTKALGQGTGLGLAQVHGIVGAHEGHIAVDTQLGEGTTFTIYLPALPVQPDDRSGRLELPALEVESLAKGQGETILVVEDNATARKALVESLKLLNYRALEAANGREALKVLEEHSDAPSTDSEQGIALVLSDVVMPEMGGIALFHTLREQGLAVPVVMLTGHPMEEELEDLRTQGLSDWMLKPLSLERLAQVVARALKETTPP